jgi:radical SAM enzyme (TIGR01210 family)
VSNGREAARIRCLRTPKRAIDPWKPLHVLLEEERQPDGALASCLTVFLAGAECPFTCVHCDLWRFTLGGPTPPGALPSQLEQVLASRDGEPLPEAIKLYNASNFFDPRAVPPEDLPTLAAQLARFRRATVESHPRLVGETCMRFAGLLSGRLEVAMGLETVHPAALPRLNKQMTLPQFDAAVALLKDHGIGTRAFVLLSPPYVPAEDAVEWAVRTVEHALDLGVDVVSLIPMRGGDGELRRLADQGMLVPPSLEMLDQAMEQCLGLGRGVVLADLWDAEAMQGCSVCRPDRIAHLRDMNRSGRVGARVTCDRCGAQDRGRD